MTSSPSLYFQRLRWRLLRNSLTQMLTHSWMRLITILLCSGIIWVLLFLVSWYGFYELKVRWDVPLDLHLIELVFDLMFFTLTVLLTFSTGIILYSSLFASAESQFLLAGPVPDDHVFAYKFQGAVAFSSWAFVLLGSPILIAYGLEVRDGAPWYFYVVLPAFFFGFVLMPGALGAVLCLLLVNLAPRYRWQAWVAIGVLLLAVMVGWLTYAYVQATEMTPTGPRMWFESLLGEMAVLDVRLIPFHWVARGLKAAALADPAEMSYQLALVWSNGLFAYLLTLLLAKRLFRIGFNRVASGGTLVRRYGGGWIDAAVSRTLFFLDPQTRLLIVKDFRTFRRDPAQWAQVIIFLGLASLYFFNMRRFYEQDLGLTFKNYISLLTMTATAFLMCAYTGRFIFPMLSLEGSKFWILGLLPLDRSRLLWGKFAFSATGCLLAGEFLVLFSNLMLSMPWLILVLHACVIFLLALGLSGLSVGLGACLPNFRETDPSKIAVGFGGTLNLVAGLLLLVVVIVLMAVPAHLVYAASLHSKAEQPFALTVLPWYLWCAFVAGGIIGVAAVLLPLRAGIRTLRRMEF
jgi:ABC-2 type transport system permease protein